MKESELGRTYKDGEIICREGDVGESMFVIQSGTVEVSKNHNGGELVLRTMTTGEIFGEIALFDRMARSATVKALGEAIVLRVDKKGFFAKACQDPTMTFNILEGMSKRIRDLTHELSKYQENSEVI
jgi:CRP-like cAMP-binding protein